MPWVLSLLSLAYLYDTGGYLKHHARLLLTHIKADGTFITDDKNLSTHFERSTLITSSDPEILSGRPREALPEMLGLPPW